MKQNVDFLNLISQANAWKAQRNQPFCFSYDPNLWCYCFSGKLALLTGQTKA